MICYSTFFLQLPLYFQWLFWGVIAKKKIYNTLLMKELSLSHFKLLASGTVIAYFSLPICIILSQLTSKHKWALPKVDLTWDIQAQVLRNQPCLWKSTSSERQFNMIVFPAWSCVVSLCALLCLCFITKVESRNT